MTKVAFVFPGQGSQSVGMGQRLAAASPAAAAVFVEADGALGESISRLAWDGPRRHPRPDRERPAGPAGDVDRVPRGAPGALGGGRPGSATGLLRRPLDGPVQRDGRGRHARVSADGVRLVRERGRLMQASGRRSRGPDGGDHRSRRRRGCPELVERAGAYGVFGVANRNSPGSGRRVRRATGRRGGASSWPGSSARGERSSCPVSVAAHSPLMADAADGMRTVLDRRPVRRPDRAAPGQPRRAAADDRRRRPAASSSST